MIKLNTQHGLIMVLGLLDATSLNARMARPETVDACYEETVSCVESFKATAELLATVREHDKGYSQDSRLKRQGMALNARICTEPVILQRAIMTADAPAPVIIVPARQDVKIQPAVLQA